MCLTFESIELCAYNVICDFAMCENVTKREKDWKMGQCLIIENL